MATIEYDPNRTARIGLLNYTDGEKRYILAPVGLKVGDIVSSGPNGGDQGRNALPLIRDSEGTFIHNVAHSPERARR